MLINQLGLVGLVGVERSVAEGVVAGFGASLIARGLVYGTVRVYTWGVNRLIEEMGGPDIRNSKRMSRFYKAMRRATNYKPCKKAAVSGNFMLAMRERLDRTTLEGANLWAAVSTAYVALLRSAEYCVKKAADGVTGYHLRRKNIRFVFGRGEGTRPTGMNIFVQRSKTDTQPDLVYVVATWGPICCVRAMWELRNLETGTISDERAAFVVPGKGARMRAMTYADVSKETKLTALELGIDERLVATHSYRSGGATAYARYGLAGYLIKKLGRWRSDAYEGYVRASMQEGTTRVAAEALTWAKDLDGRNMHPAFEFSQAGEEDQDLSRMMAKSRLRGG